MSDSVIGKETNSNTQKAKRNMIGFVNSVPGLSPFC